LIIWTYYKILFGKKYDEKEAEEPSGFRSGHLMIDNIICLTLN
jgi:hypothetical protein